MGDFLASHKNHSYFEGWYFKHQNNENTLAFIPGVNYDEHGDKCAFIQVISDEASCNIPFPASKFSICSHGTAVHIGQQIFSSHGVRVDLHTSDIRCKGWIRYGALTPLESDVMGPFRFVPFMECRHGVISMRHSLLGSVELNGKQIDFNKGIGYIEKDWGTSFPKKYLWVQCNCFSEPSCSIMVSIAWIPFAGFHFQGCIGIVRYRGREYRLATYCGVKVIRCGATGFVLKQGDYVLEAQLQENTTHELYAPQSGSMSRIIRENVSCRARFQFYRGGTLLFDLESDKAGFEFVK